MRAVHVNSIRAGVAVRFMQHIHLSIRLFIHLLCLRPHRAEALSDAFV